MLSLLKGAVLLAPVVDLVLAGAASAVPIAENESAGEDNYPPSSLITLEFGGVHDDGAPRELTLDLRIFESTTPCDYGNVTLDGEPLPHDDFGLGSGSLTTERGITLAADWNFTCIDRENDPQALSLYFHVDSVDDRKVQNASFSVQFQQVAPVSVLHIENARSELELLHNTAGPLDLPPLSLEDELAELEDLRSQLVAIEHAIALKIARISDTFDLDPPQELLEAPDCRNLKCLFDSIYHRIKGVASRLYHNSQDSPTSPLENFRGLFPGHREIQGGQRPLFNVPAVGRLVGNSPLQVPGLPSSFGEFKTAISGPEKGQPSHPKVGSGPRQLLRIVSFVAIILAIVFNAIVIFFVIRCVKLLRRRRQMRRDQRARLLRTSCDVCNAPIHDNDFTDPIPSRPGSPSGGDTDFDEKDGVVRRLERSDTQSEDSLSITMEEELAQLRSAANVVSDLIAAEEGRASHHPPEYSSYTRPRRSSTPSSILSACPTYRSVDESLPAYDEHYSPEYPMDRYQYTPTSSTRRSSMSSSSSSSHEGSTTTRSSPDEDVQKMT